MAMFNGAKDVVINGGLFQAVNTKTSSKSGLKPLVAEVSPNAILNAGGRADEVRCYPGTREEIIGKLEKWMEDENSRTSRMMWLKGPAGAGKSAILQTVAERCNKHGRHAANFFFFRGDGTRNDARPLVATLVYQLLKHYPSLSQLLKDSFATQPLICKASIEEQFHCLISTPFGLIQQSSSIDRPVILIVDGLDECEDMKKQEKILSALCAIAHADDSPFLVLVASRAEPHLVMFFNKLGTSVESIFLDDEYKPRDDIRRFVVAKFDEIRRDHHLALTLSEDWPGEADVDLITDKSSGHFIYAATVMRFIQYCPDSPALSLAAVRELRASANHNPFAELDAVYSYVFSKARDIQAVKLILGVDAIQDYIMTGFHDILQLLGHSIIEIQSLFADLTAVIQVITSDRIKISFYHASMRDYLENKSRSGVYHVDKETATALLSSTCFQKFHNQDSFDLAIEALSQVEEPTAELSKSLLEASTRRVVGMQLISLYTWGWLIETIGALYSQDKAELKAMLRSWVRFAHKNNIDISQTTSRIRFQGPSARYYERYRARYARRPHK